LALTLALLIWLWPLPLAVVGFVNPVGADDHDLSTEIVLNVYYTSRYEPGPVEQLLFLSRDRDRHRGRVDCRRQGHHGGRLGLRAYAWETYHQRPTR
jgi:hypothetical protein